MAIDEKKKRLVKLIHESPHAQGINRASWSLHTLCDAYQRIYGEYVSISSVSDYFRLAGYKFKKARKVLTSNDPTYREKLTKITYTLSHLASDEKFFFQLMNLGRLQLKSKGVARLFLETIYEQFPNAKKVRAPSYAPQRLSFPRIRLPTSIRPKRILAK